MASQMTPKVNKKKRRLNPIYGLLFTLLIPVITYFLFPTGDEETGSCMMLLVAFVAAVALGLDDGIVWWLIIVLEATLWPIFTVALPSLNGCVTAECISWLSWGVVFLLSFIIVLSAMIGLGIRMVRRSLRDD